MHLTSAIAIYCGLIVEFLFTKICFKIDKLILMSLSAVFLISFIFLF